MVNYVICNCKKVSLFDVQDVLEKSESFEDVQKAFEQVQAVTHCSTGCGGCHDKIMETISDLMYHRKPSAGECGCK